MSNQQRKQRRANQLKATPLTQALLQVSDWSLPSQPPSKVGVFEIKPESTTPHRMYAYWDGKQWACEADSVEGAQIDYVLLGVRANQQVTWRGIVK